MLSCTHRVIGKTLGQYVIEQRIGEGGMGVVYRARDTRLDRTVAVKVVAGRTAQDPAGHAGLFREARAASALNHPGICTVHQVEEVQGQTLLVMEFVEGRSLGDVIPSTGLPLEAAVRYGTQIADALAHAHSRGVVHRDLKSQNVMVTPEDHIKILDFGLAKRAAAVISDVTRSATTADAGVVAGTLAYMAPEVLRGEPADARSDIWALGVVLYEMISGARPFSGQTGYALTAAIMHEEPRPLPETSSNALGAVIAKCLARNRADRYQQASDVRTALETAATRSAPVNAVAVSRARPRKALIGLAAALVALAVSVGAWLTVGRAARSDGGIDSVAVLPFINESRDPEAEYLSDGLAEYLLKSLSQVSNLRVISRSAVQRYKNNASDPAGVGRTLGVRSVVTGRVSQARDNLAISLELVDVRDGSRIWGERYDRPLRDVLTMQQTIAREIVARLQPRLTGDEQARVVKRPTDSPEAYELYLKGRFQTAKYTEEGFRKGQEFLRQAIETDPTFALAYEGLAYNYGSGAEWSLAPGDAFPRARAAAERALELDPTSADAHSALGQAALAYDWDWPAAERHLQRAIELNPRSVFGLETYSQLLICLKRIPEAKALAQRARDADPLSMEANTYVGTVSAFAREYEPAHQQLRRALEIDPNFWFAILWVGRTAERLGRLDEARREIERANRLAGEIPEALAQVGRLKAIAGDRAGATKVLDELSARARTRYVSPYFSAVVQAALGDRDAAFASLERGFDVRTFFMTWLLIDPDLDPLRDDPRLDALVKRVGLPR